MLELLVEQIKKSNFFKSKGPQDLADRVTTFIIILLTGMAGLVALKFLMTDSMTCLPIEAPKVKSFVSFAENYVWVHGFIPASCLNKLHVQGPKDYNDWKKLYSKFGLFHYIWIPFILLLPLGLLGGCRQFFNKFFETSQYHNLTDLISDLNASKISESKIKELVQRFNIVTRMHHNPLLKRIKRIMCRPTYQYGNHLSSRFIGYKLLIVASSFLSAMFIWLIFGIHPGHLMSLPNLQHNDIFNDLKFPLLTVGYVKNMRLVGVTNNYLIHCVMSGNLIFSKIFITAQFLLLVVAFVNFIWTIKWIVYLIRPQNWIHKTLKECPSYEELGDSRIKDIFPDFINNELRMDGILSLILMKRSGNASARAGKMLLWKLWEKYTNSVIPTSTLITEPADQ